MPILDTLPTGLRSALERGNAIIVAGAGISAALAPGKAMGWLSLLEMGLHEIEQKSSIVTPKWKEITRLLLKDPSVDDLIDAATRLVRALEQQPGGFGEWLRRVIGQLQPTDDCLAGALAALDAPIFTTNYDTMLDRVLGRDTITWKEPQLVHLALHGDRQYIVHLHGVFTRPDTVIFSGESYEMLQGSETFQVLEQALVSSRSLLFLGCGKTTADPNIGRLLRWISQVLKGTDLLHYQFACGTDQIEESQLVHPVYYGDAHTHLTTYLNTLAAEIDGYSRSESCKQAIGTFRRIGDAGIAIQNLPRRPAERLFGREAQIKALSAKIMPPGTVIVVDGPAGCGKTTLALEVAHNVFHSKPRRFQRIVWLSGKTRVLLDDGPAASIDTIAELPDVVATLSLVLGHTEILRLPHKSRASAIRNVLAESSTLIVFDNFDTIIDRTVTTFLTTLPEACCVLITSRRYLPEGSRFQVGPLQRADTIDLIRYLLNKHDAYDEGLAEQLLNICDGLPLAVEWMVSRLSWTAPHEITRPPEGYSEALLDYLFLDTLKWLHSVGYTQALFSVASMPCGVKASVVDQALGSIGWSKSMRASALATLVNLYLLEYDVDAERYRALPTVKRFLLAHAMDQQIVSIAEGANVERAVVMAILQDLEGSADASWNGRYSTVDWAIERQNVFECINTSLSGKNSDLAIAFVRAVYPFAITFGHFEEYLEWARNVLERGSSRFESTDLLSLKVRLASILYHSGRRSEAAMIVHEIDREFSELGVLPLDLQNFVLFVRVIVAVWENDPDAEKLLNVAIEFERNRGVAWARLGFQGWLVLQLINLDRLNEARELAVSSLEESRALDDKRTEVFLWLGLAKAYNKGGEHTLLISEAERIVPIAYSHGEAHNRAQLLQEFGLASKALGRRKEALDYVSSAIREFNELGMSSEAHDCERILFDIQEQQGQ